MTVQICEYFAMKEVLHKHMSERAVVEMLSNPEKDNNNELLAIISDLITKNGKRT